MKLYKIKQAHFLFLALALGTLPSFRGCRDLEDCRSMYINVAIIKFTGDKDLPMSYYNYDKIITVGKSGKIFKYRLDNLKNNEVSIFLHPKKNKVTVFFCKTTKDDTSVSSTDSITIFYHRIPSLLSPHCGLQQEYIIDSVETTFASSKLIKPALKNRNHETDPLEANQPNIEIHY